MSTVDKAGYGNYQVDTEYRLCTDFLDLCGVDIPEDMQGMSFVPLLKRETPKDWRNYLYYHYYEYPGFHSVHAHYGIKGERYKLIYYYEDNVWELFDLKYDPYEIHNIYDEPRNRRLVKKLKTELEQLQHLYEVNNGD